MPLEDQGRQRATEHAEQRAREDLLRQEHEKANEILPLEEYPPEVEELHQLVISHELPTIPAYRRLPGDISLFGLGLQRDNFALVERGWSFHLQSGSRFLGASGRIYTFDTWYTRGRDKPARGAMNGGADVTPSRGLGAPVGGWVGKSHLIVRGLLRHEGSSLPRFLVDAAAAVLSDGWRVDKIGAVRDLR